MSMPVWIGLSFTGLLVIFLMITFFKKDTSSAAQNKTLRFLTALCAGFAGGFLSGEALFSLDTTMPYGVKLAISGTAGCALFFAVWFTYGGGGKARLPNRIVLSIPEGWSFEQGVRGIVEDTRRIPHFEGFESETLALKLPATEIDASTVGEALQQLRYQSNALPEYRIELDNKICHIRSKGGSSKCL